MVKFGRSAKCLFCGAALLLLCAGCGGIATTQTISPLMFFLPGFADAKSTNSSPRTVSAVKPLAANTELALAK